VPGIRAEASGQTPIPVPSRTLAHSAHPARGAVDAPVEVDRRTALAWHDAAWRAARAGTIPVGDARRIGDQLRGPTPAA
jgi:hypothetical protein